MASSVGDAIDAPGPGLGTPAVTDPALGRPRRRLAAILHMDVVGYSRLMEEDEAGTFQLLTRFRGAIMEAVAVRGGRVVGSAGDSFLIEFNSAVEAVEAAVTLQQTFETENGRLAPSRQMAFRMGINVGDVIDAHDDIFGEGVNIAARLQSVADAGGILVSSTVLDQVANKTEVAFEPVGDVEVKNLSAPVRAYRVSGYAVRRRFLRRSDVPSGTLSDKKRVTMILLWALLGWIGAHRYYAGRPVTGVLQTLTLGGLLLWWLFDMVLIVMGDFPDGKRRRITRWI